MMIEVAYQQRHINVACLANGLAVVQRLQHAKEAAVALNAAGDGVQVTRAGVPAELRPWAEGTPRGSHGGIHIRAAGLRDVCDGRTGGRVHTFKRGSGCSKFALDEEPKAALMRVQPGVGRAGRLGRRPVIHGFQNLSNRHVV